MQKIKTSFSGHETFDCKIDWLTKALQAYVNNNTIFSLDNIEDKIAQLGLGINMIKSLNHWTKVLGLIEKGSLTNLATTILEKDPFFENINTLWLLHWNLVKNISTATLYHLFFNKFYFSKLTKQDLLDQLTQWLKDNNIVISTTTVKSDIEVFFKMYSSDKKNEISMSLFSDLHLLNKQNNIYILKNISKFPDSVFLYVLSDYLEIKYPNGINSISVDDLQRGKLSIQKSLCMNENLLFSKIHNLAYLTDNKMSYSEAAGIKQIYISEPLSTNELLLKIYS